MGEMNMVDALNSAMKNLLKEDNNVVIFGEDVGANGGVFRVTDGLQKEFGEDRVFDTPLDEKGIVGTAVGISALGLKPIAEIQFSGFMPQAYDQIISHVARLRNRTRGRWKCPMIIRAPYSGGIHAPEHHSESIESVFIHTPGVKVVIPSTPYDAKGLLISAMKSDDPVIFLEPKKVYRAIKQDVPEESYEIPLGKAEIVQEGNDITVISWGAMMKPVRESIKDSEYSIELIDLRTLSPLDIETINESVKKTGRCVVVQEAPRTLGLASEITTLVNENDLLSLKAPVRRVTGYDIVFPLYKNEGKYLPSAERIQDSIKKTMEF